MYYNGHAQIRNNETTCLTKNMFNDLKLGKNCGIWIDIFPYDYVDGVKQTRKIKILRSLSYSKATKDYGRGIKGIVKKIIVLLLCPTKASCERKIKKIKQLAMSSRKKTLLVSLLLCLDMKKTFGNLNGLVKLQCISLKILK